MASFHDGLGSFLNFEKLNGTNFPFWKAQIYNVLVQKKYMKLIKFKGVKPEDMLMDTLSELDGLTKSTIMPSLDKIIYYNVNETKTNYELGKKLCGLFEQKCLASQAH